MQHFIIPKELTVDRLNIFDPDLLHQMRKVLRFKKGDSCIVMDGQGTKAEAEIEELHQKGAILRLSKRESCEAPRRRLRLYCALSKKPATFELIIQKACELGVTDLIPLLTERCQVRALRKSERLQAIIKEACEQCERCFMPRLHPLLPFSDLLARPPKGLLLAGDPWTYDKKLKDIPIPSLEDVNLVIGAEGGLSPNELQGIRQAGGTLFLLGENILRMETAAIAALSLVQFT